MRKRHNGCHFSTRNSTTLIHTVALSTDGSVFSWGYNFYGQLGDGTASSRTTPVAVLRADNFLPLGNVTQIIGKPGHTQYGQMAALDSNGFVWCWGYGGNGAIGNGFANTVYYATQVSRLSNIKTIFQRSYSIETTYYALSNDGHTLYSWGYNGHGQLGIGSTTNLNAPVKVPELRQR